MLLPAARKQPRSCIHHSRNSRLNLINLTEQNDITKYPRIPLSSFRSRSLRSELSEKLKALLDDILSNQGTCESPCKFLTGMLNLRNEKIMAGIRERGR